MSNSMWARVSQKQQNSSPKIHAYADNFVLYSVLLYCQYSDQLFIATDAVAHLSVLCLHVHSVYKPATPYKCKCNVCGHLRSDWIWHQNPYHFSFRRSYYMKHIFSGHPVLNAPELVHNPVMQSWETTKLLLWQWLLTVPSDIINLLGIVWFHTVD